MKVGWLFVLVWLQVIPVQATIVKRLDLDGLVSSAQEIIIGQVRGSETYWSQDGRVILTRHTIEVEETLKGGALGTVELTTIGGTIGSHTLYVAGMPVFRPGEDTVVFVEASGPYRIVVGLGQGKFSVANGFVTNSVRSLDSADQSPVRPIRMRLARFKDAIRQNIQAGSAR